jgi:endonuclease VIII
MPEGDNVLQVARMLARELPGRTLDLVRTSDLGDLPDLAGRRVESVQPLGKQMFVHLEGGWTLRVHLGMHGTWTRLHARERLPRSPTLVLVSGDAAWVCSRAYRAEAIPTAALRTHPRLARLGPDLLAEPAPIEDAVRRALVPAYANREIGDLVMDQRVAAGIGNIYKSETLFECRVHPRARVHQLGEEGVRRVYEKAAELMRLNLLIRGKGARGNRVPVRRRATPTTRRLWVYMRKGRPCFDCGAPIERFVQGDAGRSTYFCPKCQAEPAPLRVTGQF